MPVDEIVLRVGAALGRPDPVTSTVELRDNRVENNRRFGIDVFARAAMVASGNRGLRNGGIPLAVQGLGPLGEALVTDNLLGPGPTDLAVDPQLRRGYGATVVTQCNTVVDKRSATPLSASYTVMIFVATVRSRAGGSPSIVAVQPSEAGRAQR